jgi:hypothetical protein
MATSTSPSQIDAADLQKLLAHFETLSSDVQDALEEEINERVDARCEQDPLYWVQNCTLTENPKYLEQGLTFKEPFPRKSYFRPLFAAFLTAPRLFVPKTREMLTSWCVMVFCTNQAQWKKSFCVVQTDSEEKAKDLIRYCRILYENQPAWMKARHPLKSDPSQTQVEWASGGRILAIPKGENKIRLFHPTIYVMDEAAFLPEAEACYNAAHPVANQIIAISSAGPGWFGNECTR